MKRSMFTSTFNPRSATSLGAGVTRYPVVNLGRAPMVMGQPREFEILSDQVLARLCAAVEDYNNADTSWSSPDAAAGARTQRDATAAIQSVIDGVPPGLKNAAIWEIRKYCPDADSVLDTVRKPGPGTTPVIPPYPDVPSVDRYIPREPPPPPPSPTAPPVASMYRYYLPERRPQPPIVETGSEEGLTIPTFEEPTPPPPPPPYVPQPPVATPSIGCWYVMGKGYMWGPRPSGGENTGLSQSDCEALRLRDLDVRSVSSLPGLSPWSLPAGSGAVSAPMLTGRRVALRRGNGNGNLEWWGYQQAFIPELYYSRPRVKEVKEVYLIVAMMNRLIDKTSVPWHPA